MSNEDYTNSFYQKHTIIFYIVVIVLPIISWVYPIVEKIYVSLSNPNTILFEEFERLTMSDNIINAKNIFGVDKTISPINFHLFQSKNVISNNEPLPNIHSKDDVHIYDYAIISKWVIRNLSNIPIKKSMFHKRIQISGHNIKIIDVKVNNYENNKIEFGKKFNSAVIDIFLLNPHEKIDLTVTYAPIIKHRPFSLNWDCHIENISKRVHYLSDSIILSPCIILNTSQIIQLIIVALIMCIIHTLLLNNKGFFSYNFTLLKMIIWSLNILCHYAFAECIAYFNWNYLFDSQNAYNWPWIIITIVLEIISFLYAIFYHDKSQKQKFFSELSRLICNYCKEEHSINEILKFANISSQKGFFENVLQPLLKQGLIECTQDNSKQTKYRITTKGKDFIQ